MQNAPYPSNGDKREQELQHPKQKSRHIELLADKRRHHCARTRCERDAIEYKTDHGETFVQSDYRALARYEGALGV